MRQTGSTRHTSTLPITRWHYHDSTFLQTILLYKLHRNDQRSECGAVAIKGCYKPNELYIDRTRVLKSVEVNLKDQY